MPVHGDPAFAHSIMFDKAFGDSDDPEDKNRWLASVRETATDYAKKVEALLTQMRQQGVNATCLKITPDDQQYRDCISFLQGISGSSHRLAIHQEAIDKKSISVNLSLFPYQQSYGLGVNPDDKYTSTSSQYYVSSKAILKDNVFSILAKITNWISTLAHKGLEGKSQLPRP